MEFIGNIVTGITMVVSVSCIYGYIRSINQFINEIDNDIKEGA